MVADILVIDDDPVILRLMKLILQLENHTVTTVSNVPAAFASMQTSKPDLICCDLMMPEISGLDFLWQRRDHPQLKEIPVIVISGADEPELFEHARELGAATYLEKPFTKGGLMAKIDGVLLPPVAG